MKKKYIVTLTPEERGMLQAMLSKGRAAARKLTRARILLRADAGVSGPKLQDMEIAESLIFEPLVGRREVRAKEKRRRKIARLPTGAVAERAALEKSLRLPMPWVGVRMILRADGDCFALYDYYGNPVPAKNREIEIPLNTDGYFLRGNGSPGSFAALIAAIKAGRIEGLAPVEMIPHDFTAPIETQPSMTVMLTNVLNRPISGVLSCTLDGLQTTGPISVHLAAHEQKSVAVRVKGGRASPANHYPLTIQFDAGKDGVAVQYDTMRVNYIARKTIKIDGDLSDWEGVLPQTIQTREAAHESLTEAAWLPMEAFKAGAAGGAATTYLAYDDSYFYFAAKVADDPANGGTLRFADQEKYAYECFYPETSRQVLVDKSLKIVEKIQPASASDLWALERPTGSGRINGQWVDDAQVNELAFAIDFDIPNNDPQQVAIYIPPGNFASQGQTLELLEMPSGKLLSRRSLNRLYKGVYAVYTMRGKVRIRVRAAGWWYDARVGGIFFDPAPAAAKNRFIHFDYKTSGNWKGKYGSNGYNVIGAEPKYPAYVTVTTPHFTDTKAMEWPVGVRKFTYRTNPVTPGCAYPMDNIQIAFNAVPYADKKQWITNLPGRPPKFIWYKDTDYEYSLNLVAEKYGGGTEIWRMLVPGMPPKNFFPRQPKSPWDGAVTDGKLSIRYANGMRIVECAIPWEEIPDVHKLMVAGQPVKFTCRVNKASGGPMLELPMHRLVSRVNSVALDAQWAPHWANELAFGWEK